MSPDQQRIMELEKQVKDIQNVLRSFTNAGQLDPLIARTIQIVAGATTLESLSNVVITAPSNGQVLKYNGTVWVNGTDNV